MLSILDVCQMTGKSEKTIYRMMNSGSLPFIQKGGKRYVEKKDILSLIPNPQELEKKSEIEQKITTLTNEIVRLSNLVEILIEGHSPSQDKRPVNPESHQSKMTHTGKKKKLSSNEIRAQKAKRLLFEALDEMKANDSIPLYRNTPSITGIHRITGIDRGTISKYLQEWVVENF